MLETPNSIYQRDGFICFPSPLLPKELVLRAAAGMDAVRAGEYDTGEQPEPSPWIPGDDPAALCKIEMPQKANRALRDLIANPIIGEIAAAVCHARFVQVWWVQLLYKPPQQKAAPQATNVGWHQDMQYWGAWEPDSELFTAWIALSEVTEHSGAVRYIRGSHRWGLLNQGDFFYPDPAKQLETIRPPDGAVWKEIPAVLSAGGMSFHHSLTYHCSGPNSSPAPRKSLALHLRTEKSRPAAGRPEGLTRFIDNTTYCPIIYST